MLFRNVCTGQLIEMSGAAVKMAEASPYYQRIERPTIGAPGKKPRVAKRPTGKTAN